MQVPVRKQSLVRSVVWRVRYVGWRAGGGERGLKRAGRARQQACQSPAYGTLVTEATTASQRPRKHMAGHLQDTLRERACVMPAAPFHCRMDKVTLLPWLCSASSHLLSSPMTWAH
jgi:hypothetical protein